MTWQAEECGASWPPTGVLRCSIQACLTVKVLFNLPLRQTICMVSGIPEMAVPDWPVPDFSTPQAQGRRPWLRRSLTGADRDRGTCWWIAPGSSFRTVNGWPASTARIESASIGSGPSCNGYGLRRHSDGGIHLKPRR